MNIKYTVVPGDTLYGIAKKYNVNIDSLMKQNNLNSTEVKEGTVLNINSADNYVTNDYIIYTIKKGDNIYSIARTYNTTVDEIMKINNLDSTLLNIGDNLKIPDYDEIESKPISQYINYTVKKGDNLYSIAKKFNISVDEIMKDNNIGNTTLNIGQILTIRNSSEPIYEECYGEEYIPSNSTSTYVVKSGDTIYSIAKKFNTTAQNIKNKNDLSNNLLTIGQKLVL